MVNTSIQEAMSTKSSHNFSNHVCLFIKLILLLYCGYYNPFLQSSSPSTAHSFSLQVLFPHSLIFVIVILVSFSFLALLVCYIYYQRLDT